MIQLTYISSTVPDRSLNGPGDLDRLLAVSRRNNALNGLTGLLVFDGRRFLQTIEGEQAALNATFERIKNDPRHRALVTLSAKRVDARQFADWDMGCERVQHHEGGDLATVVDRLTADIADAGIKAHFRSFARLVRRAA